MCKTRVSVTGRKKLRRDRRRENKWGSVGCLVRKRDTDEVETVQMRTRRKFKP